VNWQQLLQLDSTLIMDQVVKAMFEDVFEVENRMVIRFLKTIEKPKVYFEFDESLMEDFEIDELTGISDQDRIDFARGRIHDLFEDNMCSVHVIDVESKAMPPASLAMTMYYHPQGVAEFYDLTICHSAEDYLASLKPECILEQGDLPDEEILKLWKKPKARRKAKSKMS
jgi:hypothetical protein